MRAAFIATVLMMASCGVMAGERPGHAAPDQGEQRQTGLALSASRQAEIEAMRKARPAEAARMGRRLAALEAELDAAFATSAATRERLARLLGAIASVERNLRFAHLVAQLENPPIPTPEQLQERDNELADIAPAADP